MITSPPKAELALLGAIAGGSLGLLAGEIFLRKRYDKKMKKILAKYSAQLKSKSGELFSKLKNMEGFEFVKPEFKESVKTFVDKNKKKIEELFKGYFTSNASSEKAAEAKAFGNKEGKDAEMPPIPVAAVMNPHHEQSEPPVK